MRFEELSITQGIHLRWDTFEVGALRTVCMVRYALRTLQLAAAKWPDDAARGLYGCGDASGRVVDALGVANARPSQVQAAR